MNPIPKLWTKQEMFAYLEKKLKYCEEVKAEDRELHIYEIDALWFSSDIAPLFCGEPLTDEDFAKLKEIGKKIKKVSGGIKGYYER